MTEIFRTFKVVEMSLAILCLVFSTSQVTANGKAAILHQMSKQSEFSKVANSSEVVKLHRAPIDETAIPNLPPSSGETLAGCDAKVTCEEIHKGAMRPFLLERFSVLEVIDAVKRVSGLILPSIRPARRSGPDRRPVGSRAGAARMAAAIRRPRCHRDPCLAWERKLTALQN